MGVLRLVLVLIYALLSVLSSFATILTRKGDLVALLNYVPYVFRLLFSVALLRGAVGWSALCDYDTT